MCVERLLVATRSPQNLQRALPGEMWTCRIPQSMSGSTPHVKRDRTQAGRWQREPRLVEAAGVEPKNEFSLTG